MRKILFVVATLAFIASCAPYQLVEPPKRVKISDTYSVSPQVKWSRVNNTFFKNVEQWTVDGAGLQALMFINNVEDGQPIFRSRRKVKIPVFRSSMNSLEIKELFENSMAAMQAQKVRVRNFKPAKFGGADGFRFTFSYKTKGGLDKQGRRPRQCAQEKAVSRRLYGHPAALFRQVPARRGRRDALSSVPLRSPSCPAARATPAAGTASRGGSPAHMLAIMREYTNIRVSRFQSGATQK